jgi:hypothetical protein
MNHPIMKRASKTPTVSDLDLSWVGEAPSRHADLTPHYAHQLVRRARPWLPWLIAALLLAVQILERDRDWLAGLTVPALAMPALAATNLKPPTPFVRQQFRTVIQEIDYKQQMIKTARHAIELGERDIERYTFDLSVAVATLDKLKAEYDWRTLEAD